MYIIVRLIISCAVLGLTFLVLRTFKSIYKRIKYIVPAIISVVLFFILVFIPFENVFITFDSPQEAYDYFNFNSSNVKLIVNGNNSDFVIGNNNGSDTYLIIPKTTEGWQIGIGSNTKRIVQKFSDGISVYVYQYKNTNDYFVTILDSNGGYSQILDSYNSNFYSLEKTNDSLGKIFVTYYTHISNFDSQYWISVNGNKILLL